MEIIPFLKAQNELLSGTKERMRDADSQRWSAKEIYNAINDSINIWGRRVTTPFMYTIPDGFQAGVYEYSLPRYIRGPIDVQIKRSLSRYADGLPVYTPSTTYTWQDAPGFHLEPDGAGGQKLRLDVAARVGEARIIWWAQNGQIPTAVPLLSADITDSATSLTIAATPNIGVNGFVKIGAEWMSYSGITSTSTTTTLSNLGRGINDTSEASHTAASSVYWGIGVLQQDLFDQLASQANYKLHALYLTNASPQEVEHHIFQVRFFKGLADEFWKSYVPPRSAKMRLTRAGIGVLA